MQLKRYSFSASERLDVITLQSPTIRTFNPVYRCGAGESMMHAALRVHFCLFQTKKSEIPCISAPKVLCCYYIAAFTAAGKNERKAAFRGAAAVTG